MDADKLMRLLVPDGKVAETAEALGLSPSLIYQERRPTGAEHTHTGTRNTIGRLDIIAELALSHSPDAVRLLGRRYFDLYRNSLDLSFVECSREELQRVLSRTSREVGEALGALIEGKSFDACSIEVEQAEMWLERALFILRRLKEQEASAAGAHLREVS
jgi:hypothetical protein